MRRRREYAEYDGDASSTPCGGADALTDVHWNQRTKAVVRHAVLGVDQPFAVRVWHMLETTLDARVESWRAGYVDACEATNRHHAQSSEMLDLRMTCLSTRLAETWASIGALSRPDVDIDVVARMSDTLSELSRIEDCTDLARLATPLAVPREVADRVAAARSTLALAKVLTSAGRYREALTTAEPVRVAALALAYRPLEAEALVGVGVARGEPGRLCRGGARSARCDPGGRGRPSRDREGGGVDLAVMSGVHLSRTDEAVDCLAHARAILEHLHDRGLRARLESAAAEVYGVKGNAPRHWSTPILDSPKPMVRDDGRIAIALGGICARSSRSGDTRRPCATVSGAST